MDTRMEKKKEKKEEMCEIGLNKEWNDGGERSIEKTKHNSIKEHIYTECIWKTPKCVLQFRLHEIVFLFIRKTYVVLVLSKNFGLNLYTSPKSLHFESEPQLYICNKV